MFSYLPDLPQETPDIWTACDGFHPDVYGNYRTGWLVGSGTTYSAPSSSFQWGFASSTSNIILSLWSASTGSTYVYNGSSWSDRNPGIALSWFAQVGNTTLACGGGSIYQRDSTTTNNFAAVASSPSNIGILVVTALNIVVAFNGGRVHQTNTIGTGIPAGGDGWASSDTNAPTTWTGGESASGNLRHTPGDITGAVAFGNDVIAFKQAGVYRGQYVGGTVKWQWTLIDRAKGCFGADACIAADDKVFFCGQHGFYSYDGAQFERLDFGMWRTLLAKFGKENYNSGTTATGLKMVWDNQSRSVFLFVEYVSSTLGRGVSTGHFGYNEFYTYNTASKKWGHQGRLSEDGADDIYAIIDSGAILNSYQGAAGVTYKTDIVVHSSTAGTLKYLTTSFNASDLPGTNYKPTLRTYRLGERNKLTSVTRCTPLWTKSDGAGSNLSTATVKTITPYSASTPMATESAETAVTMDSTYFRGDYTLSRVFQSAEIQINCEAVISGAQFDSLNAGVV